ncbi:MAG: 23S rRNA (pseudouridine(1915)-N(3))-methyltransferase RlmH [Myxococcota bacterium]
MRIVVLAVGKLKDRALRSVVQDYGRRIGRYARFDEAELKDGDDAVLVERFGKAIPHGARVVALEVDGEPWSSHDLARFVGRCEGDGSVSAVAFLIGGAYGLPRGVSEAADVRLSLSRMTLPHRLCRVVLAEQIYRAFTILRNEPYSH